MDKNKINELLKLNVNENTEKKNNLTYLSWAWAWTKAIETDPTASYEVMMFDNKPYIFDENLGYMVFTKITMLDDTKMMQLPVMDGANKAQKNKEYKYETRAGEKTVAPATMFDINTAIMRCMTKNLALFGLGLYIYAGEDLPEGEEKSPTDKINNDKPTGRRI